MAAGIDLEALRHRLKLLRDTGDSALYENRGGIECPVCSEPFDEVLATAERTRSVPAERGMQLCLVRERERLILFTHTRE